jgi:DNA-binding CsgD family transcriptional regulator
VPAPAPEPLLTQREQQVLRLLCTGHSNKLMARTLSLSENTVKTHVASVFAKLGVNRRAQVQDVAARLGLLDTRHSGA